MVARDASSDGASAVQPTDAPQAGHFDEGTDSANYVKLIGIGIALSAERNHDRLMERILLEAKDLCHADGGTLYLRTAEDALRFAIMRTESLGIALGGTTGREINFPPLPLYNPATGEPNHKNVATYSALTGESINIHDAYEVEEFDFSGTKKFDEGTGFRSKSFLTVPLKNHENDVIGVLQLINAVDTVTGQVIPFSDEIRPVIDALASQAAVALTNQQLLESQKALLDSFIGLIASAIDAKSPYTGGHCQRVPDLTAMLVKAACDSSEPPFTDFDLSEDDWYEVHIAAWLHDCGKVTTPEYVVDKATKLETIYDRIHEIRTRFEVLKRDAEIAHWKAVADGGDREILGESLEKELKSLDEDFAFIAECNMGGEFMAAERIERLKTIAQRTWTRTMDDRLGLAHGELKRLEKIPPRPVPAREYLLDDKPEQILPRDSNGVFAEDNHWGFRMEVPEHMYNLGEVYNLAIPRGTLTPEERFKINDHIVQTVVMLDSLPFPKNLRRVPEIAAGHHETMIGTGYPRRLERDDMSIPARVMAIADIFEALTASDRPYKKAKTLSESMRIMHFMKKDQHIDPDLFNLFLTSGAWKEYADRFLDPEQIDDVDIEAYLKD